MRRKNCLFHGVSSHATHMLKKPTLLHIALPRGPQAEAGRETHKQSKTASFRESLKALRGVVCVRKGLRHVRGARGSLRDAHALRPTSCVCVRCNVSRTRKDLREGILERAHTTNCPRRVAEPNRAQPQDAAAARGDF